MVAMEKVGFRRFRWSVSHDTNSDVYYDEFAKDFHVDCYVCEGCDVQLTDEPNKRCYPLGDRLYCRSCHIRQLGGVLPPQHELEVSKDDVLRQFAGCGCFLNNTLVHSFHEPFLKSFDIGLAG